MGTLGSKRGRVSQSVCCPETAAHHIPSAAAQAGLCVIPFSIPRGSGYGARRLSDIPEQVHWGKGLLALSFCSCQNEAHVLCKGYA